MPLKRRSWQFRLNSLAQLMHPRSRQSLRLKQDSHERADQRGSPHTNGWCGREAQNPGLAQDSGGHKSRRTDGLILRFETEAGPRTIIASGIPLAQRPTLHGRSRKQGITPSSWTSCPTCPLGNASSCTNLASRTPQSASNQPCRLCAGLEWQVSERAGDCRSSAEASQSLPGAHVVRRDRYRFASAAWSRCRPLAAKRNDSDNFNLIGLRSMKPPSQFHLIC